MKYLQVLLEWGHPSTLCNNQIGDEKDQVELVLSAKTTEDPVLVIEIIMSELITALVNFSVKCIIGYPAYTYSVYQMLRIFLGNQPIPAGEEDFWEGIEQTMQPGTE